VEIFFDQAGNLNVTNIALAMILTSILLATVFGFGWKHANNRRVGLQNDLARKRMMLADTSDRLILEEQTSVQLSNALDAANNTIARMEYELKTAREKIASLNGENDAVYANYMQAQKELKVNAVELQYWQYFAKRVLQDSRWYLEKVDSSLKEALRSQNGRSPNDAALADAVEPMESALELLDLADAPDLPGRIREMRADGKRAVIHLLPRLQRFIEAWESILGPRFVAKIPRMEKAVLFAGSWVHLQMVLTTMLSNAIKHSPESSPIEFEFSLANHMATFLITNRSIAPVPESVVKAKNELMIGDPQRPRFGLYLMDQIATGYRAIVKTENSGTAGDGLNHIVRTSFSFSLR
jgi:hypothetical protein